MDRSRQDARASSAVYPAVGLLDHTMLRLKKTENHIDLPW